MTDTQWVIPDVEKTDEHFLGKVIPTLTYVGKPLFPKGYNLTYTQDHYCRVCYCKHIKKCINCIYSIVNKKWFKEWLEPYEK